MPIHNEIESSVKATRLYCNTDDFLTNQQAWKNLPKLNFPREYVLIALYHLHRYSEVPPLLDLYVRLNNLAAGNVARLRGASVSLYQQYKLHGKTIVQ